MSVIITIGIYSTVGGPKLRHIGLPSTVLSSVDALLEHIEGFNCHPPDHFLDPECMRLRCEGDFFLFEEEDIMEKLLEIEQVKLKARPRLLIRAVPNNFEGGGTTDELLTAYTALTSDDYRGKLND